MADIPPIGPDPSSYKVPKKLPPGVDPGAALEEKLLHSLGFKVRPGKVLPGFNRLIVTYLAPQPIGFVKPQLLGLPEDYLRLPFGGPSTNFTPTQIIEAAITASPDRIAEMMKFEQKRALLHQELDKIEGELQLKQRTDAELETLLKLLPPLGVANDPIDLGRQAVVREQIRRQAEVNRRERLQLPTVTTPSIETRGEKVTDPAHIDWPAAGGITNALSVLGFIDQLAAALPPDP